MTPKPQRITLKMLDVVGNNVKRWTTQLAFSATEIKIEPVKAV